MIILLNFGEKSPSEPSLRELGIDCHAHKFHVVEVVGLSVRQKQIIERVTSELVMLLNWVIASWFEASDPWLPPIYMKDYDRFDDLR